MLKLFLTCCAEENGSPQAPAKEGTAKELERAEERDANGYMTNLGKSLLRLSIGRFV